MAIAADLDTVVRELALPRGGAGLEAGWGEGPARPVGWPDPDEIRRLGRIAGLSPRVLESTVESAVWIRDTPAARRWLDHVHARLFLRPDATGEDAHVIPHLCHLGPPGEHAAVVLCLLAVDSLCARHHARGVPPEVTRRTLGDIELWVHQYRARTGRFGLDDLSYLWRHLTDRLVQLGRLQYELKRLPVDYHLFTAAKADPVVLAGDGIGFDGDGHAVAEGEPAARRARFCRDTVGWTGERMDPRARATGVVTHLEASGWVERLAGGAPVVAIHIPQGGPPPGSGDLSPDAVEASLAQAEVFLPRHYPEHAAGGYSCMSWLLDPELAPYLGPDSNIVSFQERFYLLPVPGAGADQHFERVYGFGTPPPRSASELAALAARPEARSRLGGVLLDHLRRGGSWRITLGLIPRGGTRWRQA